MIEKRIYINSSVDEFDIAVFLSETEKILGNTVRFLVEGKAASADYGFLIIDEKTGSITGDNRHQIDELLSAARIKAVLIESKVFTKYEIWINKGRPDPRDDSDNIFFLIDCCNTGSNRIWLYRYYSTGDIACIIRDILSADIFRFHILRQFQIVKCGEDFSNSVLLDNEGCSALDGFYAEVSEQVVNIAEPRKSRKICFPVVLPSNYAEQSITFHAPETPGTYRVYVKLKNRYHSLNPEESVTDFLITAKGDICRCDVVVNNETPALGQRFMNKHVIRKTWLLTNNTDKSWGYVTLKPQNSTLLHLYALEHGSKKYYNIKARCQFKVSVDIYTPDIPGSYNQCWKLYDPNGIEICTSEPLRCCIQTQYEVIPQFKVIEVNENGGTAGDEKD